MLYSEKDTVRLETLSVKLYTVLSEGHLLGKSSKYRPTILKAIFKLLDLDAPRLLLKLARLILAVGDLSSTLWQ